MAINKKTKRKPITPARVTERGFEGSLMTLTWRDVEKLSPYLSARGRILPTSLTGLTVKQQRGLAKVIKQARHLALLPFTTQDM